MIYRDRNQSISDPLSRDAFLQLNRELQHFKPLLSIAEPIDWMTTKQSTYAAKALLCGDQAILVMVFDCRYFSQEKNGRFYTPPFGKSVTHVQISGKIPSGIAVKGIRTPYAFLDRDTWTFQGGVLHLTADMIHSAEVYIITIQP